MFFILSKLLTWLVMPISLLFCAMMGAIFVKNSKIKKWLYRLTIGLFLFFTNPFLAKLVLNAWEPEAIEYAGIGQKYEYAIVLAGITEPNRPPYDRVQFNKGADRIVHAVELYKLGIVEKIVIAGGSGELTTKGNEESKMLKHFVLMCGVDSSDVLVEGKSRNTRENALYTKELLGEQNNKVMLITSSFHMYRANKCFEKLGFKTTIFPTDHYGGVIQWTPDHLIIPSLSAIQSWSTLIKEWVGIAAYQLAGYI